MQLTKYQLDALETYKRWHREAPPTYLDLMLSNKRRLLLLGIACAAAAFAFGSLERPDLASLFGAYWLGSFFTHSAYARATSKFWATLERVMDWQKVDRALETQTLE